MSDAAGRLTLVYTRLMLDPLNCGMCTGIAIFIAATLVLSI